MVGTLQDIRLFVAAYEERSFTAAAQRENATQSGVSQHIRKLEQRFRAALFRRDKGRVRPTPAGEIYYRSCLDVLRTHDAATKAVQTFAQGLEGEVIVGLMPTMTRRLLAPALASFTAAHPNVAIRIVEGYSATLTQLVRSAELDFAIVPAAAGIDGVRAHAFVTAPEVFVARGGSTARPHLSCLRPSELPPLKLVVPSRANTRRLTIETYLSTNNVPIERVLELDSMFGTLDLVAHSDWVAILPGLMMETEPEPSAFSIQLLRDPGLTLDLMLIEPARRAMQGPARAFLEGLEHEAEMAAGWWSATGSCSER